MDHTTPLPKRKSLSKIAFEIYDGAHRHVVGPGRGGTAAIIIFKDIGSTEIFVMLVSELILAISGALEEASMYVVHNSDCDI